LANPSLTVLVVATSDGIDAAEEGPADAARDAVIDTDLVDGNDLAARVGWHGRASEGKVSGRAALIIRPDVN
jgi:hypothetical protein